MTAKSSVIVNKSVLYDGELKLLRVETRSDSGLFVGGSQFAIFVGDPDIQTILRGGNQAFKLNKQPAVAVHLSQLTSAAKNLHAAGYRRLPKQIAAQLSQWKVEAAAEKPLLFEPSPTTASRILQVLGLEFKPVEPGCAWASDSKLEVYTPSLDWAQGFAQTTWPDGRAIARIELGDTLKACKALAPSYPGLAAQIARRVIGDVGPEQQLCGAAVFGDILDDKLRNELLEEAKTLRWPRSCRTTHELLQPRDYQLLGALALRRLGYRAVLGDAPGLGKTVQAILCLSQSARALTPALIVCPASVLINWKKELTRWAPWFRLQVLEHGGAVPKTAPGTVTVITWDLMSRQVELLLKRDYACVIFDECQNAKHKDSQRSQAAARLAHKAAHCLALSGTPLENRFGDLWHQLYLVRPDLYPNADSVAAKPGVVEVNGLALNVDTDSTALALLGEQLSGTVLVRRLKSQVLHDLPPKTREQLWITLPPKQMRLYKDVEAQTFEFMLKEWQSSVLESCGRKLQQKLSSLTEAPDAKTKRQILRAAWEEGRKEPPQEASSDMTLVKLGVLRRLLGKLKVPAALRFIRQLNTQMLVFAEHRNVIGSLKRALTKSGKRVGIIHGDVSKTSRQEQVDAFQQGELDIMLGGQAAHTGITLTRACEGLFVERWWVPAKEEQGEDRLHRFGQTRPVRWTQLMALDTLDAYLHELISTKREVSSAVMGSEGNVSHTQAQDQIGPDVVAPLVERVFGEAREVSFEDFVRYCWDKGWLRSES